MNIKTLTHNAFVSTALLAVSLPAFANGLQAQSCSLGSTCPIPGNDGGQTVFAITPASGTSYTCKIHADAGSLKVIVSAGKDFKITQGDGIYNANPETTIQIKGRFKQPDKNDDAGEIKFSKVPLTSDGNVSCYKS